MNKLVRDSLPLFLTMILMVNFYISAITAGPPPPPANTIQQGVGINMPTIQAWDFYFRGTNLTAFFLNLTAALENITIPRPVWEITVEWGLVQGTTGDWFNHTLPGEPIYIGLQMHPDNLTVGGDYVIPNVYDKDDYHWQLELVWMTNGTQCTKDLLVMYHMRWEPPLNGEEVDPNEPQLPNEEPL